MTTPAQLEANRTNAARSTGPKSTAGKAIVARNALRHGLRSDQPVLPGEHPDAWQAHLEGIVRDLAPAGSLEAELAGRVALCLWRLRRVAAYENAATVAGIEAVAEETRNAALKSDNHFSGLLSEQELPLAVQLARVEKKLQQARSDVQAWEGMPGLLEGLPGLPDEAQVSGDDAYGVLQSVSEQLPECGRNAIDPENPKFLSGLGVPRDELDDAWSWEGWTAAAVRKGIGRMADASGITPEKALARALVTCQQNQQARQSNAATLEAEVKRLRKEVRIQEDRQRRLRVLPGDAVLGKVQRYESHIGRQLQQALHTLERLQAMRAGRDVPAPAVLDVTVNGELPDRVVAALEGNSGE